MRALHYLAAALLVAFLTGALLAVRHESAEAAEEHRLLATYTLRMTAPTTAVTPPALSNERRAQVSSAGQARVYPGDGYQRSIAYLDITDDRGNLSFCTGTIIGAGVVLTAAHCAVGLPGGPPVRSIRVVPGMDGPAEPVGSQYAVASAAPWGWESLPLAEGITFDYALVFLPDDRLTSQAGIFRGALAALPDTALLDLGMTAVMIGYPADCNRSACTGQGTNGQAPFGTYQWEGTSAGIRSVDANYVYDAIPSWHGESGAPVIRVSDGAMVAIHSREMGGGLNADVRLTPQVLGWLSESCRQHPGCSLAVAGLIGPAG